MEKGFLFNRIGKKSTQQLDTTESNKYSGTLWKIINTICGTLIQYREKNAVIGPRSVENDRIAFDFKRYHFA